MIKIDTAMYASKQRNNGIVSSQKHLAETQNGMHTHMYSIIPLIWHPDKHQITKQLPTLTYILKSDFLLLLLYLACTTNQRSIPFR